jgi:diguanylate cyclase (GGDEF)-like protein
MASDHQCAFANKLLQMLAIPAFALDTDCKVIVWNRACELLTGVPGYEVLGRSDHWRSFYDAPRPSLAELVILKRTDDIVHLYPRETQHNEHCEPGSALRAESWCDMPRIGRRRYLAADASAILDEDGVLVAVVQTLRDMTDQKLALSALEQLATRDALTGLANRRCFDDNLHAEWARALRQKQPLSLLMVDVDNFKAFNDANGHLGGDDCLKRIASSLSNEMRANDLVARYGGEEFAVILPNESLKGAAIVAERIRCQVERLQLPKGGAAAGHVTVSIGAATAIASPDTNANQLIGIADAALYRAKHMGRNRISLPTSENC